MSAKVGLFLFTFALLTSSSLAAAEPALAIRGEVKVLDVAELVVKDVGVKVHPRCGVIQADFECVDMLELDEDGLITALHIFYDTATNRQAFERETGGSWQPAG